MIIKIPRICARTGILLSLLLASFGDALASDKQMQALSEQFHSNLQRGNYGLAEQQINRLLQLSEQLKGKKSEWYHSSLNNLGMVYLHQGRYGEAEPLFKQVIAIREQLHGRDHASLGSPINNLAMVYGEQNRFAEAAPLLERAYQIRKRALQHDHPELGQALNNLGVLYSKLGNPQKALDHFSQALKIQQKSLPANHPWLADTYNNMARAYVALGDYAQAMPLYERDRKLSERTYGRNHPAVAANLANLAELYEKLGDTDKALASLKQALAIQESVYGPDHPDVGNTLMHMGELAFERKRWDEAWNHLQRSETIRAKSLMRAPQVGESGQQRRAVQSFAHASRRDWALLKAGSRLYESSPVGQRQQFLAATFHAAQRISLSAAGDALARTAARDNAGDPEIANLVRRRQDLVQQWSQHDRLRTIFIGLPEARRNKPMEERNSLRLHQIDSEIERLDALLQRGFPGYMAFTEPRPMSLAETQAALSPEEALLLIIETGALRPTPAESFVWVVTRSKAKWLPVDLGGEALSDKVVALRCGLDASNWTDASHWSTTTDWGKQAKAAQQARRDKCIRLIGRAFTDQDWPPFDFATANELYRKLLGPVEDTIKGKKLLVVTSGALTSLPLQVLVSAEPDAKLTGLDRYKDASWLIRDHAITTLPSVASLKALRGLSDKAPQAEHSLVGFADPEFWQPGSGSTGVANSAERGNGVLRSFRTFFTGRGVDLDMLASALPQLDGTRRELSEVGKIIKAASADLHFGRDASETKVKSAKLNQFRIVYGSVCD